MPYRPVNPGCFILVVSPLVAESLRFISAMAIISGVVPMAYEGLYIRAPVESGDMAFLEYMIGYAGNMWNTEVRCLRNGRQFRVQPTFNVSIIMRTSRYPVEYPRSFCFRWGKNLQEWGGEGDKGGKGKNNWGKKTEGEKKRRNGEEKEKKANHGEREN